MWTQVDYRSNQPLHQSFYFYPPLFSVFFHCFPPCDTFSGMSRNPCAYAQTQTHTHIMPCSQPKLSTFVRGKHLKYVHVHTHTNSRTFMSVFHSLSHSLHIQKPSPLKSSLLSPSRALLAFQCLVWYRVCVTVAGFSEGELAWWPSLVPGETRRQRRKYLSTSTTRNPLPWYNSTW